MRRSRLVLLYMVAAGLLLLATVMLIVISLGEQVETSDNFMKGRALIPVKGSEAVGRGNIDYIVPYSRVPKSADQAVDAAAITTLPSRMPITAGPNKAGPASDTTKIPARTREKIMISVASFIYAWDTFLPGQQAGQARDKPFVAYLFRLSPWVSKFNLKEIADRKEARSPCIKDDASGNCDKIVCPRARCLVGSRSLLGANKVEKVGDAFTIRSLAGNRAWVTGFADIEYLSQRGHPLSGRRYRRAYSLVLSEFKNRWVVERAVSESVEEVA